MHTKRKLRVHVVTMGCAKNVVDSEKLMAQLKVNGVELAHSVERADVAVINTCGFIDAAKEESIDTMLELAHAKGKGRLKKVLAMGCLTERYRDQLAKEIPEVDCYFGSHQLEEILHELGAEYKYDLVGERVLTTPSHFAYLKISEGCDNPCSFCAIPLMRGKHVSRPENEILNEVRRLAEMGVREVIVIGQDTTYYGMDRDGRRRLPDLLARIADVEGIEWVRLMYAYPAKFPLEVLDVIAQHPRVCKYLDMPVQHVADPVLKSMRRGLSGRALRDLIDTVRRRVPGIALRTTVIVGYPSEGEKEFAELLQCVNEVKFDRLGVFTYSREEGTTAHPIGDPVPQEEKNRRHGLVMQAQQEISQERNNRLIGSTLKVMVDRRENDQYVGRTEHDAPEIDNEVFISTTRNLAPGTFCDVEIVDAYEYDILGTA